MTTCSGTASGKPPTMRNDTPMVEIAPNHPCDRCDHPSKYHAGPDRGSRCMIAGGRVWRGDIAKAPRATRCWCDHFEVKP